MKNLFIAATAALSFGVPLCAASAVDYQARYPLDVHASGTDCYHFRLDGVAVADPSVNGTPWFGIMKSHPNFNELVATLLTAKASGKTVSVSRKVEMPAATHPSSCSGSTESSDTSGKLAINAT